MKTTLALIASATLLSLASCSTGHYAGHDRRVPGHPALPPASADGALGPELVPVDPVPRPGTSLPRLRNDLPPTGLSPREIPGRRPVLPSLRDLRIPSPAPRPADIRTIEPTPALRDRRPIRPDAATLTPPPAMRPGRILSPRL